MLKLLVVLLGAAGTLKGYYGDWNYAILSASTLCCIGAISKADEVIKQQAELIEILRGRLMQ
jgi:hypothetical protein